MGDGCIDVLPSCCRVKAGNVEVVSAAFGVEEDGFWCLTGERRFADAFGSVDDDLLWSDDFPSADRQGWFGSGCSFHGLNRAVCQMTASPRCADMSDKVRKFCSQPSGSIDLPRKNIFIFFSSTHRTCPIGTLKLSDDMSDSPEKLSDSLRDMSDSLRDMSDDLRDMSDNLRDMSDDPQNITQFLIIVSSATA